MKAKIKIVIDDAADNPLQGTEFEVVSFLSRHVNYMPREKAMLINEDAVKDGRLAMLDYYNHSGSRWILSGTENTCGWDTSRDAGFIVYHGADDDLPFDPSRFKGRLDEYNAWCMGEVFGVRFKGHVKDSIYGLYEANVADTLENDFGLIDAEEDAARAFASVGEWIEVEVKDHLGWITDEIFDAKLEELALDLSGPALMAIPGIAEILREELNNEVIDALVAERDQ